MTSSHMYCNSFFVNFYSFRARRPRFVELCEHFIDVLQNNGTSDSVLLLTLYTVQMFMLLFDVVDIIIIAYN